ncbi:hypothetical protein NPX13_g7961 [Xylaria arbuscula]|uniref:RNA-dependent RNA polymerase n=1 Tax=Xylaria arbuscula TaxID=114810 RepID=A0A9W8N9C0_9PEZI|nr:hypothetical protein NPX13_g7961 [Xylaria arbuscula]
MDPNRRHGSTSRHARSPVADAKLHLAADLADMPSDDGRFDLWFLEFSNAYNLNLHRPNSAFLTPPDPSASYYDDSSFYDRLRTQHHLGNTQTVQDIFAQAARRIQSQWVPKPKAETDVTPSASHLPRASTENERRSLLENLESVLDVLDGGAHSSKHNMKRPSAGRTRTSPSPKRSRGVVDCSRPPSVLSRLDSIEVRSSATIPDSPVLPAARDFQSSQQASIYGYAPSANTSKSSLVSRVFTETEDLVIPASQDSEFTHIPEIPRLKSRYSNEDVDCEQTVRELSATGPSLNHPDSDMSDRDLITKHPDYPIAPTEDVLIDLSDPSEIEPLLQEPPKTVQHHAAAIADVKNFPKRLQDVWPILPAHFHKIPLAVRWEVMRIALHCGVPVEELDFKYEPSLNDQNNLWTALHCLPSFHGKTFPEKSRPETWKAAVNGQFRSADQVVVLAVSLTVSEKQVGPLYKPSLQPLRLDLPHRLNRRFGSDRFLELIIPSPHGKETRKISKGNESAVIDAILHWLVENSHFLLGRSWRSFSTKTANTKKIHNEDILRPESKTTIMQERIYLFAEDGNDFLATGTAQSISSKNEITTSHTKMKREHLLNWLLQIQKSEKTQGQTICKLFSRIELGLSRTRPTVILEPKQIRHRDTDILSPIGKVMNDGIARMSTALARKVRDALGLTDTPAGYQGRFGSAKGFWLRDTEDTSDEIWIETYPSQRKWDCDFEEEDHRTFEVRNSPGELRSAALNLQLLPILEDRAIDASSMKIVVGKFMKESLELEMDAQKQAMQDPANFRVWAHENAAPQRRQNRVKLGHMPWLAGLPESREDQMELLLSQGFDATKLQFLRDIAYKIRKQKCDEMHKKLNAKVGRSTYAYMVIDFQGILEEDEVHLGFSSKFTDEQSGFSETFLHGMDVLVARVPAHYPSDVQRVKAVFKPELGSLKDVIIFPSKGNIPLADKLSGGDYDGDIAWVCWEPSIVNNFMNAPLPDVPDLFQSNLLTKKKNTYASLIRSCGSTGEVTTRFLDEAFRFKLSPDLLGTCTNYKEKLCYSRNSVRDEYAIMMSTLVSHLVDRAKQGIVFTEQDWSRQRKLLNSQQADEAGGKHGFDPPAPFYKGDSWGFDEDPAHIIDYLKFKVGKPTIELAMKNFDRSLQNAEKYDPDLVKHFENFDKLKRPASARNQDDASSRKKPPTYEVVLEELEKEIRAVHQYWQSLQKTPTKGNFEVNISNTYERWQAIKPTKKVNTRQIQTLDPKNFATVGISQWDLLKASYCFKLFYNSQNFVWYMAGQQLGYLKSIEVSARQNLFPVLMTAEMYAATRPDSKFVRARAALNDGRRYESPIEECDLIETPSGDDS